MIRALRHRSVLLRRVCLTLAVLAVAMKVLVPAGFMVGQPTAKNDLPFALVLCADDRTVVVQPGEALPDHHKGGASDTAGHDAPCAFAGHGVAAPLSGDIATGVVEFVGYVYNPPAAIDGLAPGRGLTGPPLPARGPPVQLI